MPPRIAIFCAIEEEIRPLVRSWQRRPLTVGGAQVPCFHRPGCFAMCVGMGPEPGRRAAEAALQEFRPELVISAGFAGALVSDLHVGRVLRPATVVDEVTGRRFAIEGGEGTVVSSPNVAGPQQKRALAGGFAAQAVDMEGAALAQVAAAHELRFMAVKVISDELDFRLLDFSRFTDQAGQLRRTRVAGFALLRPQLWPQLVRLAVNCRIAASELCRVLQHLISEQENSFGSSIPEQVGHRGIR